MSDMFNVETTDTDALAAVMKDHQNGYSVVESLERHGMLSMSDEVSSQPWEIDEEKDAVTKVASLAAAHAADQRKPASGVLTPKRYIASEIERNEASTQLFRAMVRLAFGKDDPVMVGHHIGFEIGDDFTTENEIPSADTLIFDHDIMGAVFGNQAITLMRNLAATPVATRDKALLSAFLAAGYKL